MTNQTNKRYNVFNNIHKGLRGMLFSIQLKVQRTDFALPEAAAVMAELEQVLDFFDEHADHEDRYLLANIVKQEPQIAASLEQDHVIDHELSHKMRDLIAEWKKGINVYEAAEDVFYAMNEFIAFNLYHMNKEERELLPLLWKHYSDADIHGMEQQILASIDPQVLMAESRWMMRSINDQEIRTWLGGVKMGAPAPVYNAFVGMAAEELSQARFKGLQLELLPMPELQAAL